MPRLDVSPLLAKTHRLDLDVDAWAREIALEFLRFRRGKLGVQAFWYHRGRRRGHFITEPIATGSEFDSHPQMYNDALPPDAGEAIYGSGPKAEFAAHYFFDDSGKLPGPVQSEFDRTKMTDFFGLVAPFGDRGLALSIPSAAGDAATAKQVAQLNALAHHITDRLVLRQRLDKGLDGSVDDLAILEPGGRCLDATGSTKAVQTREELRHLVRQRDRARRLVDHGYVDEGFAMWTGLVTGQWSFLDLHDAGARRRVLAVRNRPGAASLMSLSPDERQIIEAAATGRAHKVIAADLGLAPTTVANHLTRALRKLGVRDRIMLVRLYASLARADRQNATPATASSEEREQ